MKNIKKAIKRKTSYVCARIGLTFMYCSGSLMARAPGGAKKFCQIMIRKSGELPKISVNGTKFTLIGACREVRRHGVNSQILRMLHSHYGSKETIKIVNLMRRFDALFTLMSLIWLLEENEQLRGEES